MPKRSPRTRASRPRKTAVSFRTVLLGLAAVAASAALSSCGAGTALGNAFTAPLSVLSATDVVFETNLQTAVQGGTSLGGGSLPGISGISSVGGSGIPEVSGPPTSPSEVSTASAAGVSVYTAFNPADRHCLGTFVLAPGSPTAVLGATSPGSYDFWFGPTNAQACTASSFSAETSVPSRWAKNDPSTTWPNA